MIVRTSALGFYNGFGAFGAVKIDPYSYSLPDAGMAIDNVNSGGADDIFSNDVYKLMGGGCKGAHPGGCYRDGSNPDNTFFGLWAQVQNLINGNQDLYSDPLGATLAAAVRKYLGAIKGAIETAQFARQTRGDDDSKSTRATSLRTIFDNLYSAKAKLPGLIVQAQTAIANRAQQQAAAAAAAAQSAAQQQAAQAAAAAAAAAAQQKAQEAQVATQQANLSTAQATELTAQTELTKAATPKLFGVPTWALGTVVAAAGGFFAWRKFHR